MRKFFTILLFTLLLSNCSDPVTELKETIFSAQDNVLIENECNSTIEALTDWLGNTKFFKKGEKIVPGNVVVTFKDSLFSDLDGVEGTIDFGIKGNTKPYGLLCSDGKYRAGKINFKLNKPIELSGAIFSFNITESDSFYTGSGQTMNMLSGVVSLVNNGDLSLIIKAEKLKLVDQYGKFIEWYCQRTIRLVKDAGLGMWGDMYSMDGTANGTNRSGEKFEVTIEEPLIKKIESSCAKTFVKGKLTIKNTALVKTIRVNYDPNNDEACDNLIEADINGKKTVFRVE